jgi:pimeloyl-ACP methyl ester carboxylesterase
VDLLTKQLQARAEQVAKDPLSLIEFLRHQMTESDRHILEDVAIRELFTNSYREALRGGRPDGWLDDVLALRRPWGFSLGSIRTPVRLWHGAEDTFAPSSHTRWLGDRIPGAQVFIESGVAHFGAVDVLPSFLSWLVTPADSVTPSRHGDLVGIRTGAGRLLDAGVVLG